MGITALLNACLILLLVNSRLYAQDNPIRIKGILSDSSNNEPISFATVFINPGTATITDEQGNFRLSLKTLSPFDSLKISCIGYEDRKMPLAGMSLSEVNMIFLRKSIFEIEEVVVKARQVKILPSKKIVEASISSIPYRFPTVPVLYKGYYREYLKAGDEFVNLFESVMNIKDFGQESEETFLASLDYKRLNRNFRTDSSLFKMYDNKEKFVPLAKVKLVGKNELSVLMSTNPVKFSRGRSVSFIDNFRTDFVNNHEFGKARVTLMDGRPYYIIPFEDKVSYYKGANHVEAEGTIYIDATNLGVKKIHYLTQLISGNNARKLYELTVEYVLREHRYCLNYISYNNLFRTSGFAFNGAGLEDGKLVLAFTRDLDSSSVSADGIRVLFDKKKQMIETCTTSENRILITFPQTSDVSKAMRHRFPLLFHKKYNAKDILSRISMEFNGIEDIRHQTLTEHPVKDYYQYREFFVHETLVDPPPISKKLVHDNKPVFENEALYTDEPENTDWFNPPLIRESVRSHIELTGNAMFDRFIVAAEKYNALKQEETAYINTDREVYAPGDTLWFKAYVRNKSSLAPSRLSKQFFIQLSDSSGLPYHEDTYLLNGAEIQGQFIFPASMKEGYYLLTGYSSWMKNSSPGNIFKKRILIQKEKASGLRLQITYDKAAYLPGDPVQFIITCIDELNRKFEGIKFDVTISSEKEDIFECSGVTSSVSDQTFSFILPEHLDAQPTFNLKGRDTDLRLRSSGPIPVNYFIDVEFFPEGGHSLNETKSNIAFKAVTRKGNPIDISGEIIERNGKSIANVSSIHDGMGRFTVMIRNKDSLALRILEPTEFAGQTFRLPEARESGWQLTAQNKNHSIRLEISARDMQYDTALVTLMIRDRLYEYHVVVPETGQKLIIPTTDLPQGIAVVTLFNNRMIPQNERLIFINDPAYYQAGMASDKEAYGTRDSVKLEISLPENIKHPARGSWSLSVVDNQLCMTDLLDEPSMAAFWLLSPEIKGKIHNLNEYLYPGSETASERIDLLLLTQGWRDYSQLAVPPPAKPVNKDIVSGTLLREPFGREKQPGAGTLNIFFGGRSIKIPVADNGRFAFLPDFDPQHNSGIFLNAEDRSGTPKISIELDEDPFIDAAAKYITKTSDSLALTAEPSVFTYNRFNEHFSYSLINHQWLEEVVITKKVQKKDFDLADIATMKRKADKLDLENAQTMEDLWLLVDPERASDEKVTPFYRIDGIMQYQVVPVTQENANSYRISSVLPDYTVALHMYPQDIESYTVVRNKDEAQAIYGFGFNYVIDIKLKPVSEWESGRVWENPVTIRKFTVPKTFYQPKYETEAEKYSQVPDLRKTIYWDPDLTFNHEGKAIVRFFNGDRYTRIRCLFEGIDDSGTPVHSECTYDVEVR